MEREGGEEVDQDEPSAHQTEVIVGEPSGDRARENVVGDQGLRQDAMQLPQLAQPDEAGDVLVRHGNS